jgi:hypothetical protein
MRERLSGWRSRSAVFPFVDEVLQPHVTVLFDLAHGRPDLRWEWLTSHGPIRTSASRPTRNDRNLSAYSSGCRCRTL